MEKKYEHAVKAVKYCAAAHCLLVPMSGQLVLDCPSGTGCHEGFDSIGFS